MNNAYRIKWNRVKTRLTTMEGLRHPGRTAGPKNAIRSCVNEYIKEAMALASPKVSAVEKKVLGIKRSSIRLEGNVELKSGSLSSYLKGAKFLYIFLATIGSKLEDRASAWMNEGDHLRGYILDRIGSLAVELLAEEAFEAARRRYARGDLSVSMRFSPGYCDWGVEEQIKLKKVIDFSRAGIRLTGGCMMVPKKSISAVMGIGPKGLFSEKISQCELCKKKDCDYRRVY